jgi:predicted aldo/keto reductase-like oxidoreductase
MRTYTDARWSIVDYFLEQKRDGRIRHLGFSTHADLPIMREFLDFCVDSMEFCQIQLNYLDWTFQNGEGKYALLRERDIPIIVMEPVRGGKLAALPEEDEKKLRALRPDESTAAWAFRWLHALPGITTILSGMSNMEQVEDNIKTFAGGAPLSKGESDLLLEIAEGMKDSLPCTACRYCCPECPQQLDIPWLISIYNQMRFAPSINNGMRVESLPEDKRPSACVNCGACAPLCPQNIDIPVAMREFAEAFGKLPSWADISRQRDEAARRLRGQ